MAQKGVVEGQKVVQSYLWDGNVLLHQWTYQKGQEAQSSVNDLGEVYLSQKETVEDLVTWIYQENSFVPCAKIQAEEQFSIISDYLGRPLQSYDQQGRLVWQTDYDIYGKLRNFNSHIGLTPDFIPFRQLGQYEDPELEGLYYNRFRYYDASTGLYLSQDPIGLAGNNPTMYGYVKDSNKLVDPFGLSPEYFPLDNLGRPTGGFAEVTQSTLGTGTSASSSVSPPGWLGGEHPHHQQRGHLISNNHGGSGTDKRNLVTITDGTNHPGMTKYENKITKHVKAGNTVLVEVKPLYNGDELIPHKITIFGIDQNGKVIVDGEVTNGLRQKTVCCS
ncbi:RHS repeat domain-containing protein [Flavobacterium davisii]|uniref:DNA/RNA non-specific endonuclease n=1 Tax=Flavobacterium columnare TaxID=996 RepID=A0A8G0KX53_9FLAO|nr:DNA/RNA non-specific endonuclease [Flavobacterium davisii]QYS90054.1 DNA/RNA non-specific endonuclease [Flavobacterium davisii]QYS90062.1 DNA/RNA non-specific endonuclease [Flavobacterium davisii]